MKGRKREKCDRGLHERKATEMKRGDTYTLQRQYNKNSKQIFPEMKLRILSPYSCIHVSVSEYIFPQLVCLFCCRKIGGLIMELYKSLTDR
jgi:hypothetical protein